MAYILTNQEKSDVLAVSRILGYASRLEDIHNPYLILQALTLTSYVNEHRDTEDNEVLAFYGDRVIEWYVTRKLMDRFASEGEDTPWLVSDFGEDGYSEIKSKLVCRENLARIASYYDLENYIRTGKGSAKAEKDSTNVLGELREALVGAFAIDSSYGIQDSQNLNYPWHNLPTSIASLCGSSTQCNQNRLPDLMTMDYERIDKVIGGFLDIERSLDEEANKGNIQEDSIITEEDFENPKGALNKLYTKGIIDEPVYEIVDQIYDDDDNRQLWACSCTVDGYETQQCEGYYYKMKHAEADAAKKVLMEILKDNPGL